MNCGQFEQAWNQILDAQRAGAGGSAAEASALASSQPLAEVETALRSHAAICPRCGPAQPGYEALCRSLAAWGRRSAPPDPPSADLVERIVSGMSPPAAAHPPAFSWLGRGAIALAGGAAAAAALLLVLPTWTARQPSGPPQPRREAVRSDRPEDGRADLAGALASATAATWDLALTTSEPAARLGRHVLEVATRSPETPGGAAEASAARAGDAASLLSHSLALALPETPPGYALLQDFGDGLSAGVGPLSTTARQAFGFFLVPTRSKTGNPVPPPVSKGT